MPDREQLLQEAHELIENAEAYITDAEFREEHEARQIRYLQATSSALIGLYKQNQVLLELLSGEEGQGGLGRG
jgi:hypothetical protein